MLDIWTKASTFSASALARISTKLLATSTAIPTNRQSPGRPSLSPGEALFLFALSTCDLAAVPGKCDSWSRLTRRAVRFTVERRGRNWPREDAGPGSPLAQSYSSDLQHQTEPQQLPQCRRIHFPCFSSQALKNRDWTWRRASRAVTEAPLSPRSSQSLPPPLPFPLRAPCSNMASTIRLRHRSRRLALASPPTRLPSPPHCPTAQVPPIPHLSKRRILNLAAPSRQASSHFCKPRRHRAKPPSNSRSTTTSRAKSKGRCEKLGKAPRQCEYSAPVPPR